MSTVLYNLLESIRVCAIYLKAYLPDTSENILNQLNIRDESFKFNTNNIYNLNNPVILFQRIDVEEKLKELEEK